MKNILVLLLILLAMQFCAAQEVPKERALEVLEKQMALVQDEERRALKKQIEDINSLLNNGVIDKIEADKLKLRAAEERTRRIDERQAILLETIARVNNRKNTPKVVNGAEIFLDIDSYFKEDNLPESPPISRDEPLLVKSQVVPPNPQVADDKKSRSPTTVDLVFAAGLNNTVKDGVTWYDIEDSKDYQFYNSRFVEIGLALKTPLVKKNGLRLKYGISFQSNKLEPNGNEYFSQTDGQTLLVDSDRFLGDSRFVVNNLVFPIHLELGPTKERQNSKGSYYSTRNKFKIGIGGYAGVNLSARQRVQRLYHFRHFWYLGNEYLEGYNVNRQIYGLSAYVGIGAFSIYGKYDLNTIFENGGEGEQFVSVGLRLDL